MTRGIAKCALVTTLAFVLAACSGVGVPPTPTGPTTPTQPGRPAAGIDACTLLSDEEVRAGTGHDVADQTQSRLTRVFPSVCDIDLVAGGSLTIGIMSTGGRAMYENSFEPFIGQGSSPPLDRAVAGLGDKAGISGDHSLMVLEGDVLFDIFYLSPGRPDKEAVLRYLAQVILAKLACLAVGCPGYTPPPPPPTVTGRDACALLSEEDIERATGLGTLSVGPAVGLGIDTGCRWALDSGPLEYIQLTVQETGGRERFDYIANEMYETPPEHVPDLGDDAIKTGTVPGGSVYAVVGDHLITLQFSLPFSVDDPYALVLPLVEAALSRL